MLKCLDMNFIGKKHSGLADSKNIARIILELLRRGYKFSKIMTESIFDKTNTFSKFKYMVILDIDFGAKIKEIGAVIYNLRQNLIEWSNCVHYKLSEDD